LARRPLSHHRQYIGRLGTRESAITSAGNVMRDDPSR
jgi:hypothetical protein